MYSTQVKKTNKSNFLLKNNDHFFTGVEDADAEILDKLSDENLVNACQTDKYLKALCFKTKKIKDRYDNYIKKQALQKYYTSQYDFQDLTYQSERDEPIVLKELNTEDFLTGETSIDTQILSLLNDKDLLNVCQVDQYSKELCLKTPKLKERYDNYVKKYTQRFNLNNLIYQKPVGSGAFGEVSLYTTIADEKVAVKRIDTRYEISVDILRELNAYQRLKGCSHIAQLYKVSESPVHRGFTFRFVTSYYTQTLTQFIEHSYLIDDFDFYLNQAKYELMFIELFTNPYNENIELADIDLHQQKKIFSQWMETSYYKQHSQALSTIDHYNERMLQFIDIIASVKRITHIEKFMNQLFQALNHMYHTGIIHLDIKPDNLMLDEDLNLYVIDFGLSIQLPCDINKRLMPHHIAGTPIYMPVELLAGNTLFNTNVDIWSSALTLLDTILGRALISDLPSDEIYKQVEDDLVKYNNEEIFPGYLAVIYEITALSKNTTPMNYEDYLKIQANALTTEIDVENILTARFPSIVYDLIPTIVIQNLTRMLQLNPKVRPNIKDIYKGDVCKDKVNILERGGIKIGSLITSHEIYSVIYDIIYFCETNQLQPSTCYMIIDLLERYSHNKIIYNIYMVKSAAAVLIVFMSRLIEGHADIKLLDVIHFFDLDVDKKKDKKHYEQQLSLGEILILTQFNYLFTTCETDDVIHTIYEYTNDIINQKKLNALDNIIYKINDEYVYPSLKKTYQTMETRKMYSGDTHPVEFEDIFNEVKIQLERID